MLPHSTDSSNRDGTVPRLSIGWSELVTVVRSIVSRVEVHPDKIDVDCSRDALREWLIGVTPVVGDGQLVQRNNLDPVEKSLYFA